MAALDNGASQTGVANVNTTFQQEVRTPTTETDAGFAQTSSEVDTGAVTGARAVRRLIVSGKKRLRTDNPELMLSSAFNTSALQTAVWKTVASVMTAVPSGGLLVLNAGLALGATDRVTVYARKTCPIAAPFGVQLAGVAQFSLATALGSGAWIGGFGFVTPEEADASTFFTTVAAVINIDVTGATINLTYASASININSTPVSFATAGISAATSFEFTLQVTVDNIDLYINRVRVSSISVPQAAVASAMPVMEMSPFFRCSNSGAPSAAIRMAVGSITLSSSQPANISRDWPTAQAGQGAMAYQTQVFTADPSLENYANSSNPTAAVPTNTTAALGTGLGGQFWETDTLALTTDGIISSFQVPAGSLIIPPKTLRITGVKISSFIQTDLVTAAYVAQWSLAFGHTSVSLATAEAAGAKAPRRVALGVQAVTSPLVAGTALATVQMMFASPIAVQPGEFIQTVKKKVGTTTAASGVLAHAITFIGYFE